MNGKSALGAVLVALGGLMVLKFLGINLGWIISLLMPFILIGLGFVGLKNNSKIIGSVLVAVGAIMLLPHLFGIVSLLLAIGLIVWGVSMFRNKRHV
ncbi:putative membrane protein [Paenibacillus phyllosphaerae]|uniref:Putative membrane protein n=1 Tax=Paenibacillus phyllosphaerae TaxID=274593 RepID=A0A7W5FRM9_9BACL|nr:hypothetical protein [Paenibacillus phyllosphaerae]MBB3114700.1 putative membrane protein [Paenibacillus phyllosphaerae]